MFEAVLKRVLRAVFGGGSDIDLASLLSRLTESSIDSGDATGGSLTTIVDTTKNWETDKWKDAIIEVEVDDVHYYRTVSDNDATTLTITTLPDGHPVAAGDHYNIRMALRLADIDKWGGTALTGRDISTDLANLDLALTDLRDAITAALVNKATTPVIYNKTMTNANEEYSQALPAKTKKYTIQTRDGTAFRMAFVTGKVATPEEPYLSIGTEGFHHEDLIEPATLTLFFACGEAAKVIEIIAWS